MDYYWNIGIAVFLCVLSFIKYSNTEKLKEWIDNFLDRISHSEVDPEGPGLGDDDVVELEEVSDMIYDFVIRNKEIFSRIKVKDGSEGTEGTTKES